MPKFKFSFERTYSTTEGFERVIDAPSLAEAQAAAVNLCDEFDEDTPDDCSEVESADTETGNFAVVCPPGYQDLSIHSVDYIVLPDGQCVTGDGAAELNEIADQKHAAQMADLTPDDDDNTVVR